MKVVSQWAVAALLSVLLIACTGERADDAPAAVNESAITRTLVVAPFGASGDAESGPYALRLMDISSAVAAEFGSRTDWKILESDRVATLEEELDYSGEVLPEPQVQSSESEQQGAYAELAGSSLPSSDPTAYARAFPTADYVLIGTINGFDVSPIRDTSRATLSSRSNRIRSNIQYRIVETATRQWVASDSIDLDNAYTDDGMADTQVNAFMQAAAEALTTNALRKLAGSLTIDSIDTSGTESKLRLSGGRGAGLVVGDKFQVATTVSGVDAATIEIVDVYPDYAVAVASDDAIQVGTSFDLTPVTTASSLTSAPAVVRLGLTPCLLKSTTQFKNNWAISVRNRLAIYFQEYDSVQLVEDRPVFRDAVLGQQILDDLSKKREVGLPLGSLRGVDYLAVCNLESVGIAQASVTTEEVYGVQVQKANSATVLARGSAHIIDVNSAASVAAVTVDTTVPIDAGDQEMISAADRVAQKMFGALMTSLRPMSVVMASGETVILNHKSSIGVSPGDEFIVFRPGADVVDSVTGEILRNVGGAEVGRLRVTGFDSSGWIQGRMLDGAVAEAGMLMRPAGVADRAVDDRAETVW